MKSTIYCIFSVIVLVCQSCAVVEPQSFQESLTTDRASRNDVTDWDAEMRYRIGMQYANAIRNKSGDSIARPDDGLYSDLKVPFAVFDYSLGNAAGRGVALARWFNAGLSKENRYRYYFNQTLGLMAHPNTHYYTFDERPGKANASDVHTAWNEAHDMFQTLFNGTGQCKVHGWDPDKHFRRTFSKDVPGWG